MDTIDTTTMSEDEAALEGELRRLAIRLTFGINEYDKPLIELLGEMRNSLRETIPSQQVADYYEQLGKLLGRDAYKTTEQLLLELPLELFGRLLAAPRIPGRTRKELLGLAEAVIHEKGTLDVAPWHRFVAALDAATEQQQDVDLGVTVQPSHKHIEEVLLNLLEMMSLPDSEAEKLEGMKAALQAGVSLDQLLECVHDIAKFIERYHLVESKERKSIESFLVEMKENLQDMQRLVKGMLQDHSDTFQFTNSFGRTLQKNILAMKQQFDSADNFESLKRDIKSSINQLSSSLEQFTSSANNQQAKIHKEMKQVNARMNALEIVSEVLKERLLNERKMAMLDPLTGVHNRMAYDERIVDELERFERYKTPFVLSVWDLDRFKGINDEYGHQAGDRVLQALAEILSSSVRRVDFVARYGGEEFIVIIPNTTISGAMNLAEKIRRQVEKMRFHYNGHQVEVTISSGLAEARHGDTVESLFNRADEALYRAKKGGRNRCESAE
jgi:diguanylate cyclase